MSDPVARLARNLVYRRPRLRDIYSTYKLRKEIGAPPFWRHIAWFLGRWRRPFFWVVTTQRGVLLGVLRVDRVGGIWIASLQASNEHKYGAVLFRGALIRCSLPSPLFGWVNAGNTAAHRLHYSPWHLVYTDKWGTLYHLDQDELQA